MSIISSLGIGSAKVNLVLDSEKLKPCSEVTGIAHIQGGIDDQYIDNIYIKIITQHKQIYSDSAHITSNIPQRVNHVIQEISFPVNKTIMAGEKIEKPIEFVLDFETPMTISKSKVWIQTSLDIKNAVGSTDKHYVNVAPHLCVEKILNAIEELGFNLQEVKNEYFYYKKEGVPFVQYFKYVPLKDFKEEFEELRIAFIINEETVHLLLEIDNMASGIKGFIKEILSVDVGEIRKRIQFTKNELEMGTEYIKNQLHELICTCLNK